MRSIIYGIFIVLAMCKAMIDEERAGFYWIAAALFTVAQSNIYISGSL